MAIIPLRAYNREIEGMIDNGQLDEAVAHCRHILSTFPKHIASYRLLGKAHLEQQRISDATDIFQRVLSAIPDDFIANVGMSIIREDENNLDASIWHMELAYEAQPSNVAIQDELRRLYGRRDGTQPPKVRLTRGALAKMYAKGGLFDQAIAELRGAINEDPNRPDLQLLLALMLFQISQRVDAVETCVNILKKLPFCLAANQILAVCLPETEKAAAGKNYRQVAISMDPYFAFASLESISSDQVPENAVNIEKLEWKPGLQIKEPTTQPAWATSLGISFDKPAEEKLPDWLMGAEAPIPAESDENAQASVSPFIWDTQEVEKIITDASNPEEEIPGWMKDAGWKSATEETIQKEMEAASEPLPSEETGPENLAQGDIPDWLRGIAPDGVLDDKSIESQEKDQDASIPWLEKQQPGPTDTIIQWLETKESEKPAIPVGSETVPADALEEEIPDWLKDLDVPYPTDTAEEKPPQEILKFAAVTPAFIEDSLSTETAEEKTTEVFPSEETIGQLEQIETTETPVELGISGEEEIPAAAAEEIPDWIRELAGEKPQTQTSEILDEERITDLPLGVEEPPAVELPILPKEQPAAIKPETRDEIPLTPIAALTDQPAQAEPPIEIEEKATTEPSITPGEAMGLAFLGGFVAHKGDQEEESATPAEEPITPAEEPITPAEELITPAEEPITPAEEPITPAEEPIKLAEEPITLAEETEDISPDWVKLGAEAAVVKSISEIEPQPEETAPIPAAEIPDWIKGLGEIPETEGVPIEPEPETTLEPEIAQAEELPDWLKDLEAPEAGAETPASTPEALEWKEEELPDWIKEITETASPEAAPPSLELPVAETAPSETTEPISEWASEEAEATDLDEGTTVEPLPPALAWVAATDELEEITEQKPVEAETPPAIGIEELAAEVVEIPAAALVEEPIVQAVETAQVEPFNLEDARDAISQGDTTQAVEVYTSLIKQNKQLEEIIKDLQEALYRFPVDVNLWVTLGDAYLHTNELQEALNTYSKAEDLVR
jgi:tetratricopeptide (TPR) repeat protein